MIEILLGGVAVSFIFGLPVYIYETGKAHQARQEAESERDHYRHALRRILQASTDINRRLDDPNDDDGRTDTKVPDADDFNELDSEITSIAREALK